MNSPLDRATEATYNNLFDRFLTRFIAREPPPPYFFHAQIYLLYLPNHPLKHLMVRPLAPL